jgi:DNA gyrase subunit B
MLFGKKMFADNAGFDRSKMEAKQSLNIWSGRAKMLLFGMENSCYEIQILESVACIRKRPGMYVGNVNDGSGLLQLVWELVANSVDEHLAGRCSSIRVVIERDGSLVVEDDGRGFPLHIIDGKSFAEHALTTLHFTPTKDGHAPHEHVGLHGCGAVCVNALSSWLTLDVFDGQRHHQQRFERGRAVTPLTNVGTCSATGTRIAFLPDPTIFAATWFQGSLIFNRLREMTWMLPQLSISFEDRRTHVLRSPHGLQGFLEHHRSPDSDPYAPPFVVDQTIDDIRIEIAAEWSSSSNDCRVESYANINRTTGGGTHVEGFLTGLSLACKECVPESRSMSASERWEAVKRGLLAVVCVRLEDPSFEAPTKSILSTPQVKELVAKVVQQQFPRYVEAHPLWKRRWVQRQTDSIYEED